MQTGFYNAGDMDVALFDLSCAEFPTIDGMMYLHGVCDIFALALHDTYGYELCRGMAYDYDVDDNVLVHAFCMTVSSNGEDVFVDIRGCTTDEKLFEDEFSDWEMEYDFSIPREVVHFGLIRDMTKEEFETFYEAAKIFIKMGDSIYRP